MRKRDERRGRVRKRDEKSEERGRVKEWVRKESENGEKNGNGNVCVTMFVRQQQ